MSKKRLDWETICTLARSYDVAKYPVEKFLIAMRDESKYSYRGQENGELKGSKTYISRAVGCKPETVENVFRRLLLSEGGGNEILRAVKNGENAEEFCFQSEFARCSLEAMSDKREEKEQAREMREVRKAGRKASREKEEQAAPPLPESEAFKKFMQLYPSERQGCRSEAWRIWQENNLDACPNLAGCFSDFINKGREIRFYTAASKLLKTLVEPNEEMRKRFNEMQFEERSENYDGLISAQREFRNLGEIERLKKDRDYFLPFMPKTFPILGS